MIIFPAVDLKGGKAVRLKRGRANDESVFSDDPLAMALKWQELGAEYLHLIDLDGAFANGPANGEIVEKICKELSIPVQLGGGIRSEEIADFWIEKGVARLIIGTMALENPELFTKICHKYPNQIGVSLDVEDKHLRSRGWVEDTGISIDEILPKLAEMGAAFVIYTDIERDGMHSELNMEEVTRLCSFSPVPLIAAGGVSTMISVKELFPLSQSGNLQGIVSGRAIYEGTLDLAEALAWIKAEKSRI